MDSFALTALIVLFASTLHAATGFGFSILAVPLLLLIHEPVVAVQLNLVLSIALSLMLVPRVWTEASKPMLWRLMAGSLVGAPAGVWTLVYMDTPTLKLLIAGLTLGFTLLLLCRLRFRLSPARDAATGVLAGGFTAAVGMGGVPLLLYFAGADVPKAVVRATVLVFFLFIYTLALGLQMLVKPVQTGLGWLSVGALPLALLGVWLGQRLFHRLSQPVFRAIIYLVLVGNSVFLAYAVWAER